MPRQLEGFPARYPTICSRCNGEIKVGDRVVHHKGSVIHPHCHSGYDDE